VLLADAYGGYNGVVAGNQMTRAGCWAHLRRKVIEAEKTVPEIALQTITMIASLYAVEKQKLLDWKQELLPRHPMAEAIGYALSQWQPLSAFCSDGAVPIDNNASEREMKRIVLNRKNSLFVGNPRGGRTSAILASITSTCRRLDLDPHRYLTQLLVNLPSMPANQLPAWLPDQWKHTVSAQQPS
jgi:transposase